MPMSRRTCAGAGTASAKMSSAATSSEAAAPAAEREAPTRAMRGGNDAYNERQVAKRAHLSAAALLEEFERNRAVTIRAVEAADDALFARTIRSAGGVTGPLALVFHRVAVEHVLGHARDLAIVDGGPDMAPRPPSARGDAPA